MQHQDNNRPQSVVSSKSDRLLATALSDGQKMPDHWYREKEESWVQVHSQFPESVNPGAFKTRMFDLDDWARKNNFELFYNSNKPMLLARMVQQEAFEREAAEARRSEMGALSLVRSHVIQQESQDILIGALVVFAAVVMGFGLSETGIRRLSLWICLAIASVIAAFMKGNNFDATASFALYACAVGMRARNAGYKWWQACLTGLPLVSIPMSIHLLIAKERLKEVALPEQSRPGSGESLSREPSTLISATKAMPSHEEFEVVIPECDRCQDGYVEMRLNTRYSLVLKNHRSVPCDADVAIDGIQVGLWRVEATGEIRIERPAHDTGHFTFFEVGTKAAGLAGISKSSDNGLISVTFKPMRKSNCLHAAPLDGGAQGATGLSGESQQRFRAAAAIEHDMDLAFTIHLRLVSVTRGIPPVAPRATPIPPPVE